MNKNAVVAPLQNGDTYPSVNVTIGDIYPSLQDINRALTTFKYSDAWRRYWVFPMPFQKTFHASAASNTAVVIALPPLNDARHVIEQVTWSFDGAATSLLRITDDSDVVFEHVVSRASGGWDYMTFAPMRMQVNATSQMVITLTAAGVGTTGRLTVNAWRF